MSYISIIVPISRPEGVNLVCEQLPKIIKDNGNTYELIIALDNKNIGTFNTESAVARLQLPLRNLTVFNTKRDKPSPYNVPQRRDRIADTFNQLKEHIGGSQFVFGFEDDTVLHERVIEKLMDTYRAFDGQVGLVSGTQVGRWGIPYLGLWKVDNVQNPQRYTSLRLPFDARESVIHAAGFFCFLTQTSLFKDVEHKWVEPAGPDVNYGLELCRRGMTNLVAWDVPCGHQNGEEELWPSGGVVSVELSESGGKWDHKVEGALAK